MHMVIKALASMGDDLNNITIIPNSIKKYVSVSTRKFSEFISLFIFSEGDI